MKTPRQVKIVATKKGLFVSYISRKKGSHYCAAQFTTDTPLTKVVEWIRGRKDLILLND